jgi:hypothetical protein
VTLDKPAYDKFEFIADAFALPQKRHQRLHQLECWPVHVQCQSPGGTQSPIVTVLVGDADGCDTNKVAMCAGHQNVAFGNNQRDAMRGIWPIKVEDHGIGYLTGWGGAVIGLAEFGIGRRGRCNCSGSGDQTEMTSGLLKCNKGIKRTARFVGLMSLPGGQMRRQG